MHARVQREGPPFHIGRHVSAAWHSASAAQRSSSPFVPPPPPPPDPLDALDDALDEDALEEDALALEEDALEEDALVAPPMPPMPPVPPMPPIPPPAPPVPPVLLVQPSSGRHCPCTQRNPSPQSRAASAHSRLHDPSTHTPSTQSLLISHGVALAQPGSVVANAMSDAAIVRSESTVIEDERAKCMMTDAIIVEPPCYKPGMPSPHRLAPAFAFTLGVCLVAAPAAAGFEDLAGTNPGELGAGSLFDAAEGCATCHGGGYAGDRTYLPHDAWAGTMMANAARDPVFFAALAVANQDAPGVGTFCLRCHSPIAFVRGHASPPDGSAFDAVDMQGVGCDTCHRATTSGPPEAPYHRGDAQIVYDDNLDKRGPYADGAAFVHGAALDTSMASSHFCGQCHQVTNPARLLRDASGAETSLAFPLDTTYEEWSQSAFAAPGGSSCIDCHTRRKAGVFPVATVPSAAGRPDPRDHVFAGGNLFGIRAVMAKHPARAAAHPDAFSLALARTEETLAEAVRVEIPSAPSSALPGEPLSVTVRVTNLAGHKFPTGYAEGRRAWIALALVDPSGAESVLVGGYDAATGEIQASPETHVYRAVHGHWNGAAAEPDERLALHDMIVSDTRIPPAGFVATTTTLPTGEIDYADGQGGHRSWDEATFSIGAPAGATGKWVFVARVLYQPITRHYVEHLRDANVTDGSGTELLALYESLGASPPTIVAQAEATIDFGGIDGSGGGGGSGGGSASGSGSGGALGGGASGEGCDCGMAGRGGGAPGVFLALVGLWLARRRHFHLR